MSSTALKKESDPAPLTPVIDADAAIPDTAFRDAIPKLPRGEEIFMRAFAAVAWLFGLYWVIWRWSYSLNPNAMIFSVVLVIAETYGLFNSFMLIATVWKLKYRESPPVPNGL